MSQAGNFNISSILTPLTKLTGDAGGAITPTADNINLLGGNNITSTGVLGTSTITFDLTGTTDHCLQVGNATGSLTSLAAATDGQLAIGSTGVDPVIAAPTNGNNITWTLGAGTLQADVTGTTQYAVQVGDATNSLDSLAIGNATQILQSGGAGANPAWSTSTYPATSAIGDVIYASAANTLTTLAFDATATRYLSNTGGAATIPAWDQIELTNGVSGILPVTNGGTGIADPTDHSIIVGSGAAAMTELGVATDGQLVIGSTGLDPALAALASADLTIDITNGAGTIDLAVGPGFRLDSGFAAWDGAGPYFDDTVLGDFEVSESGYGYINSVRVDWAAPQTVTGMTAGNTYIIYIDNTGTIQKTTTYNQALFQDNIVLFECLRDSTAGTNNQVTVKENHPYDFQAAISYWAHETVGVLIENHNNGANIVLNGTQKIQINGADDLSDHGLYTDIPDSGGVGVVFNQYFTLGSGKWARYLQSDTFDGTWNNAGTATALGGNKYSICRLYVSKDTITVTTPTYFSVLDNTQYNNLGQAQTAIANGNADAISGELAALELAQLGFIIFEESSTSIIDVIISKETLANTIVIGGTNQAALILTDTTNFDHILSAADTNVQSALETIDDIILRGDAASDAQAALAIFTIAGGTGITTTGAASTMTVDLDSPVLVTNGGTGVVSPTDHVLLVGSGAVAMTELAVGATNQVLLGATGADPSWGTVGNAALTNSSITITDGRNITVTGSPVSLGGTFDVTMTGTTQYALQVGDAFGALDPVPLGTATQMLQSGGAGTIPVWSTATWPATTAQGDLLYSSAANTVVALTKDATATRYLANTGASNNPAWDQVELTNGVSGTLPVANGGSGFATTTAYAVLCGGTAATNPFQPIASVGNATEVLTSNGAGALPTFQAAGGGGGISWSVITANQSIVVDEGYVCNKAGLLALALPATAAVGTVFRVTGMNTDLGWSVTQGANQQIHFGDLSTTAGAGGSLASTLKRDSIECVCVVADLEFNVISSLGNISVV